VAAWSINKKRKPCCKGKGMKINRWVGLGVQSKLQQGRWLSKNTSTTMWWLMQVKK
jgi:hypothetical protein